jgi:hypothetical protein
MFYFVIYLNCKLYSNYIIIKDSMSSALKIKNNYLKSILHYYLLKYIKFHVISEIREQIINSNKFFDIRC